MLCGPRCKRGVLTLTADKFPLRDANLDHVASLLAEVIKESQEGDWCPYEVEKEGEQAKVKKAKKDSRGSNHHIIGLMKHAFKTDTPV